MSETFEVRTKTIAGFTLQDNNDNGASGIRLYPPSSPSGFIVYPDENSPVFWFLVALLSDEPGSSTTLTIDQIWPEAMPPDLTNHLANGEEPELERLRRHT